MVVANNPDQGGLHWVADLVVGVSMTGLLPEAVVHSGIVGMPPQAGVFGMIAGLLGKSSYAIVSATSSSAAELREGTLSIAGPDATLRVALGAGLVLATGVTRPCSI